jgi:hypothetical protein
MTFARGALAFVTLAAFAGCSLFSDFGELSGDPAPINDSGFDGDLTLDGPPFDGSSGPPDAPALDAGPDASPYKQAVLADQPIAYWPFDDAVGSNVARDVIGGKNAEAVGALTFGVKGADGTAVERVPGGGGFTVGDFFDLAGQQAYSIELWGWPKGDSQFENILDKRDVSGKGWIVYFRGGTEVQIEHTYAAGQRTTYKGLPEPTSRLHHIVFVFDPSQPTETRQRVYINSVRTDGFSDDGPADDVTKALTMFHFIGVLDEVAIYHRALSAERISTHYELGTKLGP